MKFLYAGFTAIIFFGAGMMANSSGNPSWENITAAYDSAQRLGDYDTIEHAFDLASEYSEAHPRDGRAMTYRGSLAAMIARESILPWRKLSSLKEGIDLMDDGVAAVVAERQSASTRMEIEVRMVRGTTSARIPKLFGRGSTARADFKAVINHPLFSSISPAHQASAYAWLAVLTARENDTSNSQTYLQKARLANADTANTIWTRYQ
ncbi:MAG: hypothetical protein AABY83_06025 [Pseudomonadota bacterium]